MSKFGIVQKSDNGVSAVVTQDIKLTKGQKIFFNDYEEGIKFLAEKEIITPQEADERIKRTRELDREYNRETLYSLRAGKVNVENGNKL